MWDTIAAILPIPASRLTATRSPGVLPGDFNEIGLRAIQGLGVYTLAAQKWKTYGDYDDIGTVAFSPTGSKVAFVARQQGKVKKDLLIFNVATETVTTAPHPQGRLETKGGMGWSGDETRLAIAIQQDQLASSLKPTKLDADRGPAIGVLEINNSSVQLFGNGFDPAWSPTGEWIAYYDPTGKISCRSGRHACAGSG